MKVNMPLNKETKPNQSKKPWFYLLDNPIYTSEYNQTRIKQQRAPSVNPRSFVKHQIQTRTLQAKAVLHIYFFYNLPGVREMNLTRVNSFDVR